MLVLPLWFVLMLCTYWEPVTDDGWSHTAWHRESSVGLRAIYDYGKGIYYQNPRLGQIATLLAYTRGPYHMIITPLVELGILAMLTVLALGRWPTFRRSQDALVAALVTAMIVTCVPQIGPMLFYRPYTGNYAFGLALNLLWLVPYRLEIAEPRPPRVWLAPLMFVLGLAAGLCNEHTGLAFIAMGLLAAVVALRRHGLRIWMLAGLVGLAVGYYLLLTAPGQHLRYHGLAGQAGILERITARGVLGNLRVVGVLALALAPALPLLVIGVIERRTAHRASRTAGLPPRTRWVCIVLALAGVACTLTLLASPKIGPRLFLASVALISAGLAGWLACQLRATWARRSCAILAALAVGYVEVRLVAIYSVVGPPAAIRLDRLERGTPGSVVTVPRYPVGPSRYFLGDDFTAPRRAAVANHFGLQAIELDAASDR